MNKYGVYINPYPRLGMSIPRIKVEAKHLNLAWWVSAESPEEVLQILMEDCKDPDWMQKQINEKNVYIEQEEENE